MTKVPIAQAVFDNVSHTSDDLITANGMPTNLLDVWQADLHYLNELLINDLSETKSPIEKIFLLTYNYLKLTDHLNELTKLPLSSTFTNLVCQYQVPNKKSSYYVDFMLCASDPITSVEPVKVFIELDGHAFHEKTKEQVTHDKQRERFLSTKCDALLRFSGSEVFNDTYGCVREATKTLMEKWISRYGNDG